MGFEKYRILLSRVAVAVAFIFIAGCKSRWADKSGVFELFLFGSGIFLVGIATLGRMWCSLFIAGYKDEKLITQGPYSLCRNPLYLFSMIGMLGIGLCTETLTFPLIFLLLFSLYYPFVIKSEEKRLTHLFGETFIRYTRTVPAFIPRFSGYREPGHYAVNPSVYRVHMFSALWFVWIAGFMEVIEGLQNSGVIHAFGAVY